MVRLAFRSAYRSGFCRNRATVWALGALALVPPSAVSAVAAEPTLVVRADVVALDHLLVYNRFGSFNPFGQIFALRRDVSARTDVDVRPDADRCSERTGAEAGVGDLTPGNVRLKDCKRARPLTLRAPAGSIVEITLTNLLRPDQPDISDAYADPPATPGDGFCKEEETRSDGRIEAPVRPDVWASFKTQCETAKEARKTEKTETGVTDGPGADWPRTRGLSLVIPGLEPLPVGPGGAIDPACTGLGAIAPGATVTCRWRTVREGTHLFSSFAAPSGGEGDAGSLGHGLFGALIVEPSGARAFRSQVTARAFDCVWARKAEQARDSEDCPALTDATFPDSARHARMGDLAYDRLVPDSEAGSRRFKPRNGELYDCGSARLPLLSITRSCSNASTGERVEEIVHGDLNAIVVPPAGPAPGDHKSAEARLASEASAPFREFTAIFHDELKTFYADRFKELGEFGQLAGIRDGFGINYGASGAGSAVLANRQRIGPAADCAECLYEEFFLESWANGDPALLEAFADDPSNVHHSYLNDKVVIRNFHAGKETHVFHLHSHQWFAGNDAGRGAYLDSQTIGPQQGFTYRVYHGGLDRFAPGDGAPKGWWQSLGSGNRNRTPGDAIFHCHLYPHFAQGMWALWRVHDVLEDGSRVLPDGQKNATLSATPEAEADISGNRSGSVGPAGEWIGERARSLGTPVPAVIPLPAQGLPLLPTYRAAGVAGPGATDAMPGYPFYIAGKPGRRSPQPPLDMARAEAYPEAGLTPALISSLKPSAAEPQRAHLDGGLPRHVVAEGRAIPSVATEEEKTRAKAGEKVDVPLSRMLALGDMTSEFLSLKLELLPQTGTRLEVNAMSFHGDGKKVALRDAFGRTIGGQNAHGAYDSPVLPRPSAAVPASAAPASASPPPIVAPAAVPAGHFAVNGSPSAPGAPFADPCAAPLSLANGTYRRFNAVKDAWEPAEVSFARIQDPFRPAGEKIVADPALIGFRRFDVSAAQLSLVVNRAGWHDPQARINMLSTAAGGLLPSGERIGLKGDRRADAEPLFFRAFSGECIEFHHTNETPKHLELDDFQMKVPTDTIGQHIHLVKFDVTSSDGSGNGFNYEDGTFAPDEVLERICKSKGEGGQKPRLDETVAETVAVRSAEECHPNFIKKVPSLARLTPENLKYFQTTVQRWFADPILANDGENTTSGRLSDVADRTMRTVFTHDHFGPSNIQQHGFYSALLIEPSTHATCRAREAGDPLDATAKCVVGPAGRNSTTTPRLASDAQKDLIGARADVFRLRSRDPADQATKDAIAATPYAFDQLHPDSREYAIAVADFALLYDGKSRPKGSTSDEPKGVDRLVDEANNPEAAGSSEDEEGEIAPARALLDRRRQRIDALQLAALSNHRDRIRLEAGRPIAPPRRPEAISADHHDPYLVNYRDEPVPLRVGGTSDGGPPSFVTNPCRTTPASDRHTAHESIVRQRSGPAGGLENLFLSKVHGDPCTPILEGLSGERIVVRLI